MVTAAAPTSAFDSERVPYVASLMPRLRARARRMDRLLDVDEQLTMWVDLANKYPDRLELVVIGHTISGALNSGMPFSGEPMVMAAYIVGESMVMSPTKPDHSFNVVVTTSDRNERMEFPRRLAAREYVRTFRRGFGSHGPESDWEFVFGTCAQTKRPRLVGVRPITPVTAALNETFFALLPERVLTGHSGVWERWLALADLDNMGIVRDVVARQRQYFGPESPFHLDFPYRDNSRGAIAYHHPFYLGLGTNSFIDKPDPYLPKEWRPDEIGIGGAVRLATGGATAIGSLELPLFGINLKTSLEPRKKSEAFAVGDEMVRELMAPLLDQLQEQVPRDGSFDSRAAHLWLDSLEWVRTGEPSGKWTQHLPTVRNVHDGPATDYEQFCVGPRRVFLNLCRIGQAQRLLSPHSPLFEKLDALLDGEVEKLEQQWGLTPLSVSRSVNAYADFILENLFHWYDRPLDLGPVPRERSLEMS
jgi:hypothetical protein